ncbi:MAG: transposase [Actinomycetota bacterium]|nr:transposase [Actinomycetota bacterium]
MPRQPRLEAPGLIYHVIARGIERREIFTDKDDYTFFLTCFGEILVETHADCLAFSLLPNHFHLLFRSGEIPLSTIMRRLLTRYALFFNRRHRRSGHLFQNRYKSIICQEDPYLLELVRYIHLNPIRAGITKSLSELNSYSYTGHSALLGRARFGWYLPEAILGYFGKTQKKAIKKYLEFIGDGLSMGTNPTYTGNSPKSSFGYPKRYPKKKQISDGRILGDEDFVRALQECEEKEKEKGSKVSIEELTKRVAKTYSLEPEQIRGRGRAKQLREARTLVAYVATTYLGFSFAEIARYLKVHRSTSARMLERGKEIAKGIDAKQWIIAKEK